MCHAKNHILFLDIEAHTDSFLPLPLVWTRYIEGLIYYMLLAATYIQHLQTRFSAGVKQRGDDGMDGLVVGMEWNEDIDIPAHPMRVVDAAWLC